MPDRRDINFTKKKNTKVLLVGLYNGFSYETNISSSLAWVSTYQASLQCGTLLMGVGSKGPGSWIWLCAPEGRLLLQGMSVGEGVPYLLFMLACLAAPWNSSRLWGATSGRLHHKWPVSCLPPRFMWACSKSTQHFMSPEMSTFTLVQRSVLSLHWCATALGEVIGAVLLMCWAGINIPSASISLSGVSQLPLLTVLFRAPQIT